jgi:biopolymer transport protein TolR
MGMSSGVGTGRAVSEINVTPLIDVLLVLLIIFMVIVPVAPRGLRAVAPQPSRTDVSIGNPIVVQVQADSRGELSYRINENAISKSQIESRLAEIFAARQEKTMFVQADAGLEFSKVAEVIDMGHQAEVDNVGLITPRIAAGQ